MSYYQRQTLEHFNFSKLWYQYKGDKLELKDDLQFLSGLYKTFVHLYFFFPYVESAIWRGHSIFQLADEVS